MTASSGTTSFTSLALSDEDLFLTVLNGFATIDPVSLAASNASIASITVTGARVGNFVIVAPGVDLQGIVLGVPYVSADDTVKVPVFNPTGGAIDIASSTWKVKVFT